MVGAKIYREQFREALGNDLNTSQALTVLYDMLKSDLSDSTKRWLAGDFDKVLGLDLLPEDFYRRETESYLEHINTYGLPLDSRADYTKSDWICWCAAMAPEESVRRALLAPVAKYVRETATRVPFSDWYDTRTGRYVAFIARSVQGGVFMPFLSRPHPGTPK